MAEKPHNHLPRSRSRASVEAWVKLSLTRTGRATSRGGRRGSPTRVPAFESRRVAGRTVRRPDLTLATMDHNVATGDDTPADPLSQQQLDALQRNCDEFGVPLYATGSGREGVGPV